ncbi:bifunctional metallophosphatase/5'-nucleotidase [Eremococcus coleocola]|uniref:Ser/Thr phosphatase family protein n=1 Tax=Eremococcus coleocola ACS-139-V-Col8 TaxID=908337 RepID=E4KNE8_9LACT|nr:bifunctional UDP-sugar hydrolase/5'-nucleotidase [Eremococcus coleocola]EFR31502.1 Ser/Thr phosphatase family protein [Eremococcus coleocola ACS-139-V-Col8]
MLHIIHTNDLHGHIENWPILRTFMEEKIAHYLAEGDPYLLVDIGDALDSVNPMVEASKGQIMIDLFNQIGYDVVTIGNNEGLNFTSTQLSKLYDKANFDITIANLLSSQTQDVPEWGQKVVFKQVGAYKLAFIGLTAPYATYPLNGYEILNPIRTLKAIVKKLQKDPSIDLIVLMSHLGIEQDRYIAKILPEIQLIIGAHTHHVLFEGEWVNQTLLTAAGRYGLYIGEIDFDYDPQLKQWYFQARVLTLKQVQERLESPVPSENYIEEGRYLLAQETVTHSSRPYFALQLQSENSYIQMALDALAWYANCPLAILNSGLFLSDLPAGRINQNDLHESLPHPMHLARVTLKGSQLITMLNEMEGQREDLSYKMIHGLGFRGKIFGELVYRGLTYDQSQDLWLAQGQPIQSKETYELITVDHLWFLPFFPSMEANGLPQLIFPDFIRHVVAKYLKYMNETK